MAMSMLRAQQEKQGATHDVTDVTGPGLKKTSSVANFQCMGHIKKGIPPALRGDRREGLKRNLSITNFQAMGHTPKTKYEDGMTKSATVPAVQSPEDNFVSLLDRTDPG